MTQADSSSTQPAPWRALFFFTTRSHIPLLIFAILSSVISGTANPAQSFIIGKLFNQLISYGLGSIDAETLLHQETKYVLYTIILAGIAWLVRSLELAAWLAFGESQARSAQDRLFESFLRGEIGWYDERKHGIAALLARMQTQIRELQLATSQPLGTLFMVSATAVLSLIQAFFTSWDLALVTISTVPVVLALVVWIGRGVQHDIEKHHERLSEAQKLSSSALQAISTVKCYNGEETELKKYNQSVSLAARWYSRIAHANALQMALFVFLSVSVFVQGFYYGSVLVSEGKKSTGQVITTFLSAIDAFQAFQEILPQTIVLEKGRTAGQALRTLMLHPENSSSSRTGGVDIMPPDCKGAIDIRNLTFAYPTRPDHTVLNNVSLYVPSGKTAYIIGASGSGKSTLGQLLVRFYPLSSGTVTIDGHNLAGIDPHWLRSNITLVEQQAVLFNDTILANIILGRMNREEVLEHEIMEAVEFALLESMVKYLPNGLDNNVGQGGCSLSGGQCQRVALARARLRDAPILILDESTSALDRVSRDSMMEAIRKWRQNKTTLIITHDVTQINPNDYVFILEDGRLVQQGHCRHMEQEKESPFKKYMAEDSENASWRATSDDRHGTSSDQDDGLSSTVSERREFSQNPIVEAHRSGMRSVSRSRLSRLQTYVQGGHVPRSITSPGTGHLSAISSRWPRSIPSPSAALSEEHGSYQWDLRNLDNAGSLNTREASPPARQCPGGEEEMVNRAARYAAESRTPQNFRNEEPYGHMHSSQSNGTVPEKWREDSNIGADKVGMRCVQSLNQVIGTVWPCLDRYCCVILIVGLWSATVHAVASPVFAYTLSRLLNTYTIPGGHKQQAVIYAIAILAVAVTDAIHVYLLRYLLEYVGQYWVDSMRSCAFQRVLDQPLAFFQNEVNSPTSLSEQLDRNAEEMRNLLGRFAAFLYILVTLCVVSLIWSLIVQWKLTLTVLVISPYMYTVSTAYARVSQKWESLSNDAYGDAGAIFAETFLRIKTVKALTLETHFRRTYAEISKRILVTGLKRSFFLGFFHGLSDSAGLLSTAVIFYIATRLVLAGAPLSSVIEVLTILMVTVANVSAIITFIPQIGSSMDTATRLLQLAQLPSDSHEHLGDVRLSVASSSSIAFEQLTFAYPSRPSQPVLQDLRLTLRPSTSTAIVGRSGSGKSTLASLLLNLYPVHPPAPNLASGLEINGHDITSLHTPSLRRLIASMPQHPTLFPASVAANIAYALPSASQADITTAARQAGIHDFIASLPQGYDTAISGSGGGGTDCSSDGPPAVAALQVSGGQAARIVLARALLRRPAVLLLDEPTAALDWPTAKEILRGLQYLRTRDGDRAMLVVLTHDLRVMERMERVIVIENGRVVEDGGFGELMGRYGGKLRELVGGGERMAEDLDRGDEGGVPGGKKEGGLRAKRGGDRRLKTAEQLVR